MKNRYGHSIVFGAVALSSAMPLPPPSLNNLYTKTEMRLAYGGPFAVVEE